MGEHTPNTIVGGDTAVDYPPWWLLFISFYCPLYKRIQAMWEVKPPSLGKLKASNLLKTIRMSSKTFQPYK